MGQLYSVGCIWLTSGLNSLQNKLIFILFNVNFLVEKVEQIVAQEYSAIQWYAGKCLITGFPMGKKSPACSNCRFPWGKFPTMAHFKLPTNITEHRCIRVPEKQNKRKYIHIYTYNTHTHIYRYPTYLPYYIFFIYPI